MAEHAWELLRVAQRLILPVESEAAPDAAVRRSISTTYYALFHFLPDECARALIGSADGLARRRNIFMRAVSHRGARLAVGKVAGEHPVKDVAEFFRQSVMPVISTPRFAREFASIFLEAYQQRQQADYDLNVELDVRQADVLIRRAERAMTGWSGASDAEALDLKGAFALLIALHGKLRAESE